MKEDRFRPSLAAEAHQTTDEEAASMKEGRFRPSLLAWFAPGEVSSMPQ